MGLFDLFKKRTYARILNESSDKTLRLLTGRVSFTEAEQFRGVLYTTIIAIGLINSFRVPGVERLIDAISDDAKKSIEILSFRLSEVAITEEEKSAVRSHLPSSFGVDSDPRTNGGFVFPILFNAFGPAITQDMFSKGLDGPFGPAGYAATVISTKLAIGSGVQNFMGLSMEMDRLLGELLKR